MTHGVGSLGHGGGHHGGGFSGFHHHHHQTTTHHYHSSHSGEGASTGDCVECCCCLCSLIGFFLCLAKMKRRTRFVLIWVWMISIFLTAGLVLGVNWYKPQTKSASPTDMRIVGGLSSVFCEGVSISSDEGVFSYLLEKTPEINTVNRTRYTSLQKVTVIKDDQYEYWGYHLLSGSNITVHSCVDFAGSMFFNYLNMYVIKGYDNFQSWLSDMNCDDCYLTVRYYRGGCYSSAIHGNNYTLQIMETDDYYFAFANTNTNSANLKVIFDMFRTTYRLDEPKDICRYKKKCKFSMTLGSSEAAVVYVPDIDSDDMKVRTRCQPRVWLYLMIFCFIPLLIGGISCFITWKVCDNTGNFRPYKEITWSVRSASSTPNELTPVVTASTQSPPTYEQALKGVA